MEQRRNLLVGLALFLITFILYWPVTAFNFVAYDDQLYVYENNVVIQGLTWSGIKWALTAIVAANWHPLTMLSHMLDWTVYGRFAGGHHLTSLFLHATNAVLLWWLLKRLTQAFWPSALVAALFAWHPLNVESVAWVAERKNVLSTFFLILTLWAYVRYVEVPKFSRYGLALGLFALGLMAKPMLVTLPCLLILLDYWPLRRLVLKHEPSVPGGGQKKFWNLLWEKIPFFLLAAAASITTVIVQNSAGMVKSLHEVPLALRLLNAPVAGVAYLAKAFWPTGLCAYYPLPAELPVWPAIGSVLALAAITGLIFYHQSRFPWLLFGWLWFLITLAPVIGIIQVGNQAMADRYAYVPLIGLFVAVAWSANHWLRLKSWTGSLGTAVTAIFLLGCLILTHIQIMYWHDGIALFSRAIAVTKNNVTAHENLGIMLSAAERSPEAIAQFEEAVRINPSNPDSQYNLGLELMGAGEFNAAELHFSEALKYASDNVVLHNSLGVALAAEGKMAAAASHFQRAIELKPDYPKPYLNYAMTLQKMGDNGAAFTNFSKALQFEPDQPEALEKMAAFLATCPDPAWHQPATAIKLSQRANEITGYESPGHLETLALTYASNGDFSNAVHWTEIAGQKAAASNLPTLADRLAGELKAYQAGMIPPFSIPSVAAPKKSPERLEPGD
jgi:tetratricopeptide (TPR) repeat protein